MHMGHQQIGMRGAPRRRSRGMTLLELSVVISIVGILTSIAVPNLRNYLANTRIATTTDELVTALNVARTEAIKRGTSVVLCSANDVDTDDPYSGNCDGAAQAQWHIGWMAYATPRSSNPIAYETGTGQPDDNTPLLQFQSARDDSITVISNAVGTGFIHFDQRGFLRNDGTVVLAICDERGAANGRIVSVSRLGHPRVLATSESDPQFGCTPS